MRRLYLWGSLVVILSASNAAADPIRLAIGYNGGIGGSGPAAFQGNGVGFLFGYGPLTDWPTFFTNAAFTGRQPLVMVNTTLDLAITPHIQAMIANGVDDQVCISNGLMLDDAFVNGRTGGVCSPESLRFFGKRSAIEDWDVAFFRIILSRYVVTEDGSNGRFSDHGHLRWEVWGTSPAAVPEPSALLLLGLGGLALLRRRHGTARTQRSG
jgi:hypothetical protein